MGDTSTADGTPDKTNACNQAQEMPTISLELWQATLREQLREAIAARRSLKAALEQIEKQITAFHNLLKLE